MDLSGAFPLSDPSSHSLRHSFKSIHSFNFCLQIHYSFTSIHHARPLTQNGLGRGRGLGRGGGDNCQWVDGLGFESVGLHGSVDLHEFQSIFNDLHWFPFISWMFIDFQEIISIHFI